MTACLHLVFALSVKNTRMYEARILQNTAESISATSQVKIVNIPNTALKVYSFKAMKYNVLKASLIEVRCE